MAAMVAPHVDSVQSSTPTAWRAARGRSARGYGQKPTEFESALAGARGSATRPRGPATLAPPPAHTLTASRPPQNRAHERTDMHRRTPRLRNSELAGRFSWRAPGPRRGPRPALATAPLAVKRHARSGTRPPAHAAATRKRAPRTTARRGRPPAAAARAVAAPPPPRIYPQPREHTPHTSEPPETQAREPVEGPVPRLGGRRRHPRHQAQRQEGSCKIRQDHVAHQKTVLRPRQQVHQAERFDAEGHPGRLRRRHDPRAR